MNRSRERILHWQTVKIFSLFPSSPSFSPSFSLSPLLLSSSSRSWTLIKLLDTAALNYFRILRPCPREVPTCFRQIGKFVSSTSVPKKRTSGQDGSGNDDDWMTQFRNVYPLCSPESRRTSRNRISSRSADRQRETR